MKRKGFTLIELLAVIIILGILMLIAIPSVTSYINNSRKETYVNTLNEIIKGTVLKVNSGEIEINDPETTYYVPCSCIKLENGETKSPYGKFDPAYVVVTYDGDNYNYYFTGKDVKNMGVPSITKSELLSKETIVANVSSIDTSIGIEGTSQVTIFNDDCSDIDETKPVGNTVSGEGGFGESGSTSKILCQRATTLHTETCNNSSGGCGFIYSYNETMRYGNLGTSGGSLEPGDAFDCDVNDDGIFDEETERFYYLTSKEGKSVLIYYTAVENGTTPTHNGFKYYTNYDNYHGPSALLEQLPSTSQWKHPSIILPGTREIKHNNGTSEIVTYYNSEHIFIDPFTYTDRAARLATANEIAEACGVTGTDFDVKSVRSCPFLCENIPYFYENNNQRHVWTETPRHNNEYDVWEIDCYQVAFNYNYSSSNYAVKPAIEVLTSNIRK